MRNEFGKCNQWVGKTSRWKESTESRVRECREGDTQGRMKEGGCDAE